MSLLAPIKKARGLGSAKDGVHHWWMQRVTAIALVPLTLWVVFSVASMSGQDYESVQAWLSKPFTTAMFALFIFTSFYHAALGLQVIIEDYVHNEAVKFAALIGVKLVLALLGTVSVVSVLRVAFAG